MCSASKFGPFVSLNQIHGPKTSNFQSKVLPNLPIPRTKPAAPLMDSQSTPTVIPKTQIHSGKKLKLKQCPDHFCPKVHIKNIFCMLKFLLIVLCCTKLQLKSKLTLTASIHEKMNDFINKAQCSKSDLLHALCIHFCLKTFKKHSMKFKLEQIGY